MKPSTPNIAMDRLMVFTGNANPRMAQDVAKHLGLSIGRAVVGKFSDGEVMVEIMENVRGKDVFVLQSTCQPTNDNLMELMVMVDALKRSSAARVSAAMPYFGYARRTAAALGARRIRRWSPTCSPRGRVAPADHGPVPTRSGLLRRAGGQHLRRAGAAGRRLEAALRTPHRGFAGRGRRGAPGRSQSASNRTGDHRQAPPEAMFRSHERDRRGQGRTCVIMDDMVDTAGTLCKAAEVLKAEGAVKVVAYCTHAVLSGDAVKRIDASAMDELVVTDTIPLREDARACKKIRSLSVAGLLAETILRIFTEDSVSSLFIE
jgi:ribose-phosphate pyrophosphokinase